jgi:lysophospholipase L1-like esterase
MRLHLILLLLVFSAGVSAQEVKPPFWNDIQAFKRQDSINFPGAGKILFVGSSSFTNWKDVQSYFPGYPVINRGFGGSSLPDLLRYKEEVIFNYRPKQIVMYCGENDFAANDTLSVNTVVGRFKQLFSLIRERFSDVPFAYVSMKPSPSREHLMPKYEAANNIIREFLKKYKHAAFIDVYHAMLKPDGRPMDDIFLGDKLHMNAKGYVIWQKIIEPYLIK